MLELNTPQASSFEYEALSQILPKNDLDDYTEYKILSKKDVDTRKGFFDKNNNHIKNLEHKAFHFAKVRTDQKVRKNRFYQKIESMLSG